MKKGTFLLLFFVLLCNSAWTVAQTEPEQIKVAPNLFQEFFFESLLQKGIENYDKAIVALEKCQTIDPENATVYFELGKNYLKLKDYPNAYSSFEKATKIDPKNEWFWVGMYDVSYETRNYNQGIQVLNNLIGINQKYKEDLVSLFMATQQFDKATNLINDMDTNTGKSDKRELYKLQMTAMGKSQDVVIPNLLAQIEKNPDQESNYLLLISIYSKNNEDAKALEIAKKLTIAIPLSEWGQVGLFKNYLENKESQKAINALNVALASAKIDAKIKHRMLNEFLIFVYKNPEFTPDLQKAISYFDSDPDLNVAKEVGKFYQSKTQWEYAALYYKQAISNLKTQDVETNLLLLQALTTLKKFEEVIKNADEMIAFFPSQPQFYYYSGLANNQLRQFKKAQTILEIGLDYVLNDTVLEINFNIQLGESSNGLGDLKKKEFYFLKADELQKNKK